MDEEKPIWARLPGEKPLWFGRFERYRLLWPHSIPELYREELRKKRPEREAEAEEERGGNQRESEPAEAKDAPGSWYQMAKKWQWEERAAAWDVCVTAELEELHKTSKARTLVEGFAPMHRRVQVLSAKVEQLLELTEQEHRVWLADAKLVGEERVNLVHFNAPLFHELRASLADIAAELGERVKKRELAITELPANVYGFDPDQDGVDDQESEQGEEESNTA